MNNSTDTILVDKVYLSSSDSHVVGSDLGSKANLDATHLNIENSSSVLNIENPVIMKNSEDDGNHETTNTSFTENHSNYPGSLPNSGQMESNIFDSKDETNKMVNIIEHDLNHAHNVTSIPESHFKRRSSVIAHSTCRFKILLIFAVFCIIAIGCYLIVFVVDATQFRSNTSDGFSNISSANVSYY